MRLMEDRTEGLQLPKSTKYKVMLLCWILVLCKVDCSPITSANNV